MGPIPQFRPADSASAAEAYDGSMICGTCGTVGTADDLMEIGGECAHDWCDGIMSAHPPPQRFYFTFGLSYSLRNNYVVIFAESRAEAIRLMHNVYGRKWAFDYDEAGFAGQPEMYGLTEVPFGTPNYQIRPL